MASQIAYVLYGDSKKTVNLKYHFHTRGLASAKYGAVQIGKRWAIPVSEFRRYIGELRLTEKRRDEARERLDEIVSML